MLVIKRHEEVQYSRWYVDTCVLRVFACAPNMLLCSFCYVSHLIRGAEFLLEDVADLLTLCTVHICDVGDSKLSF